MITQPSFFETKHAKSSDIPSIVSLLHLSTKYQVLFLRSRAIEALQKWYPTSLSDYIPMCSAARQDFFRHVLVANIAREADVPILLPSALLFCCSTASGPVLYDGVVKDGVHYELNPLNMRALFIGRPLLGHAARTRTQSYFFNPHKQDPAKRPKCMQPARCTEFCRIYSSVFDEKDDPWMNPFFRLNWNAIRSTCCIPCTAAWENQQKEEMDKLWAELPSFFQLSPWDKLEEQSRVEADSDDSWLKTD